MDGQSGKPPENEATEAKVEVLPPDTTKQLEQIQAVIGALVAPLVQGMRDTQQQETTRLRSQLRYQLAHQVIGALIVVLAVLIASGFAYVALQQGRHEFAERIVFVIIGVAIGFVSGRVIAR